MGGEVRHCRHLCEPYMRDKTVIDLGFGGDRVVPWAQSFDLEQQYGKVGDDIRDHSGDARDLSRFTDNSFDVVFSSHLLEDFPQAECEGIVVEWARVARERLILYLPDQERFMNHCRRTGQAPNCRHKWDMHSAHIVGICRRHGWCVEQLVDPHYHSVDDYSFFIRIDVGGLKVHV